MCASLCSARRGTQCQKGQRDTAGGEEDDRCWGKGKDNTVSDGVTKNGEGRRTIGGASLERGSRGEEFLAWPLSITPRALQRKLDFKRADRQLEEALITKYVYKAL